MQLKGRRCECLEKHKCTNGLHKAKANFGDIECGLPASMAVYTPDGSFGLLTCVYCAQTYAAKDWQVFARGDSFLNPLTAA
jgi:hypothetical protein